MLIAVARWIYIYIIYIYIYVYIYIQVQEIERTRSFCLKHPEAPSDPSCSCNVVEWRHQCDPHWSVTIVTRGLGHLGPRSRYYEVMKIKHDKKHLTPLRFHLNRKSIFAPMKRAALGWTVDLHTTELQSAGLWGQGGTLPPARAQVQRLSYGLSSNGNPQNHGFKYSNCPILISFEIFGPPILGNFHVWSLQYGGSRFKHPEDRRPRLTGSALAGRCCDHRWWLHWNAGNLSCQLLVGHIESMAAAPRSTLYHLRKEARLGASLTYSLHILTLRERCSSGFKWLTEEDDKET